VFLLQWKNERRRWMTTASKETQERVSDIETILRLMAKHDWTTLTIEDRQFVLTGDGPGSTWVHGTRKEDLG
jgi:hypothetical protein